MSWFWLNVPPMSVFILATAGIPMWLVLRHPDNGPVRTSRSTRMDATPQSMPVIVVEPAASERELVRL